MITTTMTAEEIAEELKKELDYVMRIADAKQKKADRIIRTAVRFPVYLHTQVVSPRKNRWLILWEAGTRKDVGDKSLVTTVCISDIQAGKFAFMPTFINGDMIVMMFTPHFFQRFSLRAGIDLKGEELIRRYFERNPSYGIRTRNVFKNEDSYVTHVTCTATEGAALGLQAVCSSCAYFVLKTLVSGNVVDSPSIASFSLDELHIVST